jgi:hypothetical protein
MSQVAIIRRRRAGRGDALVRENNFVAGPDRGNRKGAGARRGNANALVHGIYSAARRARHANARQLCDRARDLANLMRVMAAAQVDPGRHEALLAVAAGGMEKGRCPAARSAEYGEGGPSNLHEQFCCRSGQRKFQGRRPARGGR